MSALRNVGLSFLICSGMFAPAATYIAFAERAVTTGHTDLVQEFRRYPTEDNYGVFIQSRKIRIVRMGVPIELYEQDGAIVRKGGFMMRTLPVYTYSPADAAHTALYRKHFPV